MTIRLGQDRIGHLDAEIASLYKEVGRLEDESFDLQDKGGDLHLMLDLQSKALREQARALDMELSHLLIVESRTSSPH